MRLVDADRIYARCIDKSNENKHEPSVRWSLDCFEIREVIRDLPTFEFKYDKDICKAIETLSAFCKKYGTSYESCCQCPFYSVLLQRCYLKTLAPLRWDNEDLINRLCGMSKMRHCDNCAHRKVCKSKELNSTSMTYCADKLVLDKEKC